MAHGDGTAHDDGQQQHPISLYFKVWGLLFVLSAASYAVDYYHVESYLRWSLVLIFMMLKAGFIVAVFSVAFFRAAFLRVAFFFAAIVFLLYLDWDTTGPTHEYNLMFIDTPCMNRLSVC